MRKKFQIESVGEPTYSQNNRLYVEGVTKRNIRIAFWGPTIVGLIKSMSTPFTVSCACTFPQERASDTLTHDYWVLESRKLVLRDSNDNTRTYKRSKYA